MKEGKKLKELKDLSEYIGLDNILKSWVNCHFYSKKYFENKIVEMNTIKQALDFYNLTDLDYRNKCFECVDMINNDDKLKKIFFLLYYILFIDNDGNYRELGYIEHTNKLFNKNGNFFILIIVLLNAIDIHKEKMKYYNYDKKQIKYHINAVNHACSDDIYKNNLEGIRFSSMVWGSFWINANIIKIGRLQYEISKYDMNYNVYINIKTKQIKTNKENNFDKLIYNEGNYRVKIHIPKGKNLYIRDVKKSLKKSKKFIKKYFKDKIKNNYIYTCKSWLLSPELKYILKEKDNIIKFQSLFYNVKEIERKTDFLDFIFGKVNCQNYNDLSEDTTLQKGIKSRLLNDEKLNIGIGILK